MPRKKQRDRRQAREKATNPTAASSAKSTTSPTIADTGASLSAAYWAIAEQVARQQYLIASFRSANRLQGHINYRELIFGKEDKDG